MTQKNQNTIGPIATSIYLNEIWRITQSILALQRELDDYLANSELTNMEKSMICPSATPHKVISTILGHTARLQKMFLAASKTQRETEEVFEFRKQRAATLRRMLLKKQTVILETKTRNSIEHFDARLDAMASAIASGDAGVNSKTLFFYMSIRSTSIFKGNGWSRILAGKVFVVEEQNYYIFEENLERSSINIGKLFEEVEKLDERVKIKFDPEGKLTGPAGLLKAHPHTTLLDHF